MLGQFLIPNPSSPMLSFTTSPLHAVNNEQLSFNGKNIFIPANNLSAISLLLYRLMFLIIRLRSETKVTSAKLTRKSIDPAVLIDLTRKFTAAFLTNNELLPNPSFNSSSSPFTNATKRRRREVRYSMLSPFSSFIFPNCFCISGRANFLAVFMLTMKRAGKGKVEEEEINLIVREVSI